MSDNLADILLAPARREALAADCVTLIESHIHGRGGFRGITLKTGLAMMKKARPDILPRAVNKFLGEFVGALEPVYAEFRASGRRDFGAWLAAHDARVADALIAAVDRRMAASTHPSAQTSYRRFRGMAEEEVQRAVPAMAAMLARHLKEPQRA
jgi:hypothetical protein